MDGEILEVMGVGGTDLVRSDHIEFCLIDILTKHNTTIALISHIDLHIRRDSHGISMILEPLSKFFECIPTLRNDEVLRHGQCWYMHRIVLNSIVFASFSIGIYHTGSTKLSIKKSVLYCKALGFGYTADTNIDMSDTPKKRIPKFRKKLSGFLSDEWGKITKEDVLHVWLLAMGIATLIPVAGAVSGHVNAWHANMYGWHPEHANFASNCSAAANPINVTVNGHINNLNPGLAWLSQSTAWHANHANHGSHSSHLSHSSY